MVQDEEIIGIFDMDTSTVAKHTRDFLAKSEKKGHVINVSFELPKSFVVCSRQNTRENRVYISQISTGTLFKRSELWRNGHTISEKER